MSLLQSHLFITLARSVADLEMRLTVRAFDDNHCSSRVPALAGADDAVGDQPLGVRGGVGAFGKVDGEFEGVGYGVGEGC